MFRLAARLLATCSPWFLLLPGIVTANGMRSDHYQRACGGFEPEPMTSAKVVAARSRLECVSKCSIDDDCFLAEYDTDSGTCSFYQQTEIDCTTTAQLAKVSYIKVGRAMRMYFLHYP